MIYTFTARQEIEITGRVEADTEEQATAYVEGIYATVNADKSVSFTGNKNISDIQVSADDMTEIDDIWEI